MKLDYRGVMGEQMQLLGELKDLMEREESPFRLQLLKEDIARLEKLQSLSKEARDLTEFHAAGASIGWTQNDMMTHRIAASLKALLDAIYAYHQGAKSAEHERCIRDAWIHLCDERNKKLVKCL